VGNVTVEFSQEELRSLINVFNGVPIGSRVDALLRISGALKIMQECQLLTTLEKDFLLNSYFLMANRYVVQEEQWN
jgi:hypothetical protein